MREQVKTLAESMLGNYDHNGQPRIPTWRDTVVRVRRGNYRSGNPKITEGWRIIEELFLVADQVLKDKANEHPAD